MRALEEQRDAHLESGDLAEAVKIGKKVDGLEVVINHVTGEI